MKKLNKSQIVAKLKKVVSPGNKVGWGKVEENLVTLEGKFCSDELREIASMMDDMFKGTKLDPRIEEAKNLNVSGFTAKDCRVYYSHIYDEKKYNYQFVVVRDGNEYDFYYGKSDQGAGDWWPTDEDDEYGCMAFSQLIPAGFSEASENCYEYCGSHEEAIALLKACGFTVIKGEDYC